MKIWPSHTGCRFLRICKRRLNATYCPDSWIAVDAGRPQKAIEKAAASLDSTQPNFTSYTEDMAFRLGIDYQPRGDQVTAIESLLRGIRDGDQHQVLLGVTGSGKTFTCNVQDCNRLWMMAVGCVISTTASVLFRAQWKRLRIRLLTLYREHLHKNGDGPPWIAQAILISGEDHRFFDHAGIDFIAVARAIWRRLTLGRREGASTIEMQLVRVLSGRFERTLRRKILEAGLATLLVSAVPKHSIPALYLRIAYYGNGMNDFPSACSKLRLEKYSMSPFHAAGLVARLKYPEASKMSLVKVTQLSRRTEHLLKLYTSHRKGREYRGLAETTQYATV